jgi:hypothetical protein
MTTLQKAVSADTTNAKSIRRRRCKWFTRLGVMLMIALVFGLAAELLVRLPPH